MLFDIRSVHFFAFYFFFLRVVWRQISRDRRIKKNPLPFFFSFFFFSLHQVVFTGNFHEKGAEKNEKKDHTSAILFDMVFSFHWLVFGSNFSRENMRNRFFKIFFI